MNGNSNRRVGPPPSAMDKNINRKNLSTPGFEPTFFLEQQVNTIAIDGGNPEDKLNYLFDSLTNHLVELANDIEAEAENLQESAVLMEQNLFEELEEHLIKVKDVASSVESVKVNFEHASDNAVKIGARLQNSEKERLNIVKSMELLAFIKEFQSFSDEAAEEIPSMNALRLKKEVLPQALQNKEWSEISKTVHDLRKITVDLTVDELSKAQKVICNIAEVIENELLGQFDNLLEQIMEGNSMNIYSNDHAYEVTVDEILVDKARTLTECLHLFNNGNSVQKRYIFSVIQKRIPNNVFSLGSYNQNNNNSNTNLPQLANQFATGLVKNITNVLNPNSPPPPTNQQDSYDNDDELSSAGAGSDNESDGGGNDNNPFGKAKTGSRHQQQQNNLLPFSNIINNLPNMGFNSPTSPNENNNLVDNLSNLFNIIDKVCREQFEVIRKIFPTNTIARVTRLLVQRIFGDPAFGIQAKVDNILCPEPPQPPLSLSDYLDALLTVREKLSGLHLLLIECSLDPALIGMGSESESLRKAKNEVWIKPRAKPKKSNSIGGPVVEESDEVGPKTPITPMYLSDRELEESDEKMRSDADVKEFLDEQVSRFISSFVFFTTFFYRFSSFIMF
jgi:HPt (histidine-containing phosphotransfer) domain-containing protein